MQIKEQQADVAIIVGRFQCDHLHSAHVELIKTVSDKHPKTVIFLGLAVTQGTINNPLDYSTRRAMIAEKFPDIDVAYIKDCRDDKVWSASLDTAIGHFVKPGQKVLLYGSRDSFIPHYKGRYPTCELVSDRQISATELRAEIRGTVRKTPDFRAGIIYATDLRFPTVYTTVDVAIFNEDYTKLLLGQKPNEDKYRFVGGFSSPDDSTFEEAAQREVREETGLEICQLEYLGSQKIDDWRYRNEVDKVITLFFTAKKEFGAEKAADDLKEIRWWDVSKLTENDFMPEHIPLFQMLSKLLKATKGRI